MHKKALQRKTIFCCNYDKDELNKHYLIHAEKLHFGSPCVPNETVFWNRTPSDPFSVSYPSHEELLSIFQKLETQFAVNVARPVLRESNCRGRKRRSPLDERRLLFVHDAVMEFRRVPVPSRADVWKQCIKRIDNRCRRPRFKDFAASDSGKEIYSYY